VIKREPDAAQASVAESLTRTGNPSRKSAVHTYPSVGKGQLLAVVASNEIGKV
jgi:hypothetical protein